MDLILWRHADAAYGVPDEERQLSQEGREQAAMMADWLKARVSGDAKLFSSPFTRARQTAMAFGQDVEILREAAPGASPYDLLSAVGWPGGKGVAIVVGHQPDLGETTATILTGGPLPISFSKGTAWWFRSGFEGGRRQVRLVSVMAPDLL